MIPMVHWPETMVSYDLTDHILFSGDAFGSFGALNGTPVDTHMDTTLYWSEMERYYANIVGKYGAPVQKALQKLDGVFIEMICSTHGPVWTGENVAKVVGVYDRLSRYATEEGVVIAYGSMYGNTQQMAEAIAEELSVQGIRKIVLHDVSRVNHSYILAESLPLQRHHPGCADLQCVHLSADGDADERNRDARHEGPLSGLLRLILLGQPCREATGRLQ